MKKVAVLVLGLSLIGSMSVAQGLLTPFIVLAPAPVVVVAGVAGGAEIGLAVLPLLLVAIASGDNSSTPTTAH